MPTLAIIGRPNVGKSTLFNRLTGKRHALVDNTPGVTRDWREGEGSLGPMRFTVIDTAGWEYAKKDSLQARMVEQTKKATERADALLMVIDGREGVTATDRDIIQRLRKSGKPMGLAMNKTEGKVPQGTYEDALSLGLGEPAQISAEHGEGLAELYDVLAKLKLDKEDEEKPVEGEEEMTGPLQIAIIGQPNAGKSTLMNRILGEERVLTGPEAGITRDAISASFTHNGQEIKLVDTAGMRKKSKIDQKLEKMAVEDTLRVIQYAHVVVVLMDAACPLERQDLTIVALVEREGRSVVVALNKWDEVKDKEAYLKLFRYEITRLLPQVKEVPVVPVSALKGTGVTKLLDASLHAYKLWNTKLSTSALNRWLADALDTHQPPSIKGRRLKFRYITQTKIRPPTFQLFSNMGEKDIPESYMRYLMHSLRGMFDLPGVPVRITLKKSSNPYETS